LYTNFGRSGRSAFRHGYSLLGFISYERGALADTVRHLTKALELDGSDADAMFFRGIALEAAGQGEAAIAAGRRFVDVDPLAPMAGVLLNSAQWFVGQRLLGLCSIPSPFDR
jgi:hypothetical protein